MSKKTTKTIKKTTSKSTTAKKSSMTKKESETLDKAKEQLDNINKLLSESSIKLPSLVSTQNVSLNSLNGIIQNKYQADAELIGMLEEF
ncbi:MAG: hypothetical protein ACTSPK_10875, partial [Candidatus Heimdallarchaeota archaeon]